MTLQTVRPPDRGSLAVVYACPECGYEMAMLTNAHETQVVQSMGVRIGRADASPEPASARVSGKCPFGAMVSGSADVAGSRPGDLALRWTDGAEARLGNIPDFARPMARAGIERFARDNGRREVDEPLLEAAWEFFGM
jgi:hypothetical protein